MDDVLFLVHRIPYPPNKGDKLRSYNLLKQLSRHYRVHLGAFIDDERDWQYVDAVRALCRGETHFAKLSPRAAKLRSLPSLLSSRPLSLAYYRDRGLRSWVRRLLREQPIRRVLVFSSAMAQYVDDKNAAALRRVMDFVDVDSDKWRQYAASRAWPMNWLYRREARTLLRYERRIAATFDASVFVSAREADLFKALAPETAARVWGIRNGVDSGYFDPVLPSPAPYPLHDRPIVFTGAMDYWANVEAVTWFAKQVLPAVRAQNEEARFYIVGARPTPEVIELKRLPGVVVVGGVEDIRPYIAHAVLAVAPLRIARGVQNKVLEAMAMAKPVVATPQALDGIVCEVGREVLLAESAADFAAQVAALIERGGDPALACAARARVVADYNWESNLRRFERLLESAPLDDDMNDTRPVMPGLTSMGE